MRTSRGQYHLWTEKFPSLNQLVEYYKSNSVSKHTRLLLLDMEDEQQVIAVHRQFLYYSISVFVTKQHHRTMEYFILRFPGECLSDTDEYATDLR